MVFKPYFDGSRKENECIEIIFDSGDLTYSKAVHRTLNTTYEDFFKRLKETVEGLSLTNCNICVIPASIIDPNTPDGRAKRSKREQMYRASVWIMEIEPDKQTKIELTQKGVFPLDASKPEAVETARELIEKIIHLLPVDIKKAVSGIYFTGGGINLIVSFSRCVNYSEAIKLSSIFKKIIEGIKEVEPEAPIDVSCADVFHAQRLAGTRNVKYSPSPFVRFVDRDVLWKENGEVIEFEPLNIDAMLLDSIADTKEKKKQIEELENLLIKATALTDYNRVSINELLSRANIPSLFNLDVVRETSNYYLIRCPFHPPDNNPSFVVYKNLDKDGIQIAYDFHDGRFFNAISLAQELYGYDFKEAVKWIGEQLGITPEKAKILSKVRMEKIKEEATAEDSLDNIKLDSEAEKWLLGIGVDLHSVQMERYAQGDKIQFIFKVKNLKSSILKIPLEESAKSEQEVEVKLQDKDFFRPDQLLNKLIAATANTSIAFPDRYQKPSEKKDFCLAIYRELVLRSYMNNQVYQSQNISEYILFELLRYIHESKKLKKTAVEVLNTRTGVFINEETDTIVVPLMGFYEVLTRNKMFAKLTYDELPRVIGKIPGVTISKVQSGIDILILSLETYENYYKSLIGTAQKLEKLDEFTSQIYHIASGLNPEKPISVDLDYDYIHDLSNALNANSTAVVSSQEASIANEQVEELEELEQEQKNSNKQISQESLSTIDRLKRVFGSENIELNLKSEPEEMTIGETADSSEEIDGFDVEASFDDFGDDEWVDDIDF